MIEIDPKISRLYREVSTGDPPAALDAAILAAARKQVAKHQRREGSQRDGRSQRRGRSLWSRLMVPVGAIATLVLGVSIALLVERERPGTSGGTAIRQTPPLRQSWPPAPVTESLKPKAADSAAPEAAARKEAPAGAAPAQASALPAPALGPAEPAPSTTDAFPAESRAKEMAPRVAAPTAATESNIAGESATGGAGAAAPAAPAAAGKLAPMRQQAIQRSPEDWLDEIRRLMSEGREHEAAEQLAEFRNAYPAYSVPESLLKNESLK